MKRLRTARWILAGLSFALAAAYLVAEGRIADVASAAYRVQIIPSMLSVSLGATLFWLVITMVYGRLYCATVCPVGTLLDLLPRVRGMLSRKSPKYRYRKPHKCRYYFLIAYAVSLAAGLAIVPALLEPWNIFGNMLSPGRMPLSPALARLGLGATAGIAAGIVSFVALAAAAIMSGREFCNTVCPVGSLLGIVGMTAGYRIELDPDRCVACMKCEEACPAGCIRIAERRVDDSRCVRCMECVARCPEGAIRYQSVRNRAATPMMRHAGGR